MKMIYNGTPVKSMKVNHYEVPTNDCDMVASDLQAGKTAVARGKKIIGTGKSFEFANYGQFFTNFPIYVPSIVNIIEIASMEYPVKISIALSNMKNVDFSVSQRVGSVIMNNIEYPITVSVENNLLTIFCDQSIYLEVFYGKDNYV